MITLTFYIFVTRNPRLRGCILSDRLSQRLLLLPLHKGVQLLGLICNCVFLGYWFSVLYTKAEAMSCWAPKMQNDNLLYPIKHLEPQRHLSG